MNNSTFKEIDSSGFATLEVISEADNFNQWMFNIIKPYCTGDIIEIGSGIGNISNFFIEQGYSITISDIRDNYCKYLHERFGSKENVQNILNIDLTDPDFRKKFKFMKGKFNTLFSLNVIEHIEDDMTAMDNAKYLLRKGGTIIILVPAFQSLFNRFDVSLDHYRRYTKKTIDILFKKNNIHTIHLRYFNFVGMIGWFFSGKIHNRKIIPLWQMRIFNKFVPVFKIFDFVFKKFFGLSVIAVGQT